MPNIYLDNPENFEHDQTRITLKYNVVAVAGETLSDTDIRQQMIGNGAGGFAPQTYAPTGATVPWPIRGYKQEEVQPGIWKVSVTYSAVTYTFSFDLGGANETVYQSRHPTVHSYNDPAFVAAAPDFGRAINVDASNVHGASIFIPTATWTEALEVPANSVTGTYRRTVYGLVGTQNEHSFRGCDPYSVLFKGCTGSISTANPLYFSLTFKFAFEPNRSIAKGNALTVGGITNIEKDGWDYLWVYYQTKRDNVAKITKRYAAAVYVEQVYDVADFAALNIGTGDQILWGG